MESSQNSHAKLASKYRKCPAHVYKNGDSHKTAMLKSLSLSLTSCRVPKTRPADLLCQASAPGRSRAPPLRTGLESKRLVEHPSNRSKIYEENVEQMSRSLTESNVRTLLDLDVFSSPLSAPKRARERLSTSVRSRWLRETAVQ